MSGRVLVQQQRLLDHLVGEGEEQDRNGEGPVPWQTLSEGEVQLA